MKFAFAILTILTINAQADISTFCESMQNSENKVRCYQKIAPLANNDVIRSCALFRDEFIQKLCLDAVEVNPTAITSNMIQDCFWHTTIGNNFNDGLAIKCLQDLKNKKGDLP
ncbi:MAG: hypothetical protein IPM57_00275 [Oligoflexia bacterium]|nr:hypothetical protein [Oligoflexia bacterium]